MGGLLNRSEIGFLLVEHVLVDFIFFTLHMYSRLQRSQNTLKSATSSSQESTSAVNLTKGRNFPQQTLDMLTQYEACKYFY